MTYNYKVFFFKKLKKFEWKNKCVHGADFLGRRPSSLAILNTDIADIATFCEKDMEESSNNSNVT